MSLEKVIKEFPMELQDPIKHLVDEIKEKDFGEIKTIVKENTRLIQGNTRLIQKNSKLIAQNTEAIKELAEAQKRTETKVEELAEAQKRTETKVEELAEAQKRTETKVEELAEAQKRTETKIEELAEAQNKTEVAIKELAEETKKGFKMLQVRIDTISTRFGRMNENALRNGLAILLKATNFKVEREHIKDEQFGEFELDIVIYDGSVIAVEVKASFSYRDAFYFQRCVEKYSSLKNKKINRKIVISPDIDPRAALFADKNGIELVSHFDL